MSNIKINLRGDVREFPSGVTGLEVAQSIGAGLAKAACAVSVNRTRPSVFIHVTGKKEGFIPRRRNLF